MSSFHPGSHTRQKSTLERVLFEATVNYRSAPGKTFSGLCSDLSAGGLYLRTTFPLEKNDLLEVSFSLPNSGRGLVISCKARVAWTNFEAERRKPNYPSGVGLEFLNLSPEEKDRLTAFIETYDEHKKMNVLCAWCGCCLGTRKGPFGVTSHGICEQCRLKLAEQT